MILVCIQCIFPYPRALTSPQAPSIYLHSISVPSNQGDNVASALLPLNRLAFVEGGQSAEPLPAAEPGLSAWPLARGGFKRVGARGSSHSHGRTTQEHPSKVSPCPLAQQGPSAGAGINRPGYGSRPPHPDNHTPHTTFPNMGAYTGPSG